MKTLTLLFIFIICQVAVIVAQVRMLWCIFFNQEKAWVIAKAFDRLGNAATNDDEVQTISARASKARTEGKKWGCYLCKLLDSIQKDHCKDAE